MIKNIAVALVAAGGLLVAASPAHAGGHVSLSVGVGIPVGGYGYAAPSYYGPPPVVYAPAPVYGPPPGYYGRGYYGRNYGPNYAPGYYAPRVVYRPAPGHYEGRGWHDHGWRR